MLRLVAQIAGDMCAARILYIIWLRYRQANELHRVVVESRSQRGGGGVDSAFVELNQLRHHHNKQQPTEQKAAAVLFGGNGVSSASASTTLNDRLVSVQLDHVGARGDESRI